MEEPNENAAKIASGGSAIKLSAKLRSPGVDGLARALYTPLFPTQGKLKAKSFTAVTDL